MAARPYQVGDRILVRRSNGETYTGVIDEIYGLGAIPWAHVRRDDDPEHSRNREVVGLTDDLTSSRWTRTAHVELWDGPINDEPMPYMPVDSASHTSSSQAGLASLNTSAAVVTKPNPTAAGAPTSDHGPLAASLSDSTLAAVLSRPAYVPSIVMLDRDAAAQHLADEVTSLLMRFSEGLEMFLPVRQALADYRETVTR